jgi:hypothetical protein
MVDSIRQQIVDEIKIRLAAITPANGYETDLGEGLILEDPPAFQEEELPALGVFDLVNQMAKDSADQKAIPNQLAMQVRIFLKRETNLATARKMIADVKRAIIRDPGSGAIDPRLGPVNAVDTLPEEDAIIRDPDTYQVDGAYVGFVVQFLTEPFNAYQ